jgi:hypothetical protein
VVEKVLEMRLFTLIQIPLPPPHSFPRAHRYESYDLSEVQRAADPEAVPGALKFPQRLQGPVHGWLPERITPIRMRFHNDRSDCQPIV